MGLSPAAPGELEVVRAFINSRDIELDADALGSPAALQSWLADHALIEPGTTAKPADVQRAVAFREALREACTANHDRVAPSPDVVRALNAAGERAKLAVSFTDEGGWTPRVTATGVDRAIGRLVLLVLAAMSDSTWSRLKICVNDTCRWAFYDHSRARSGKWCSMRACGNRAKQQAWRSRHDD